MLTPQVFADMPTKTRETKAEFIPGWFADTAKGQYEIGVTDHEKHSGSACGYIESIVSKPKKGSFGNLCQWFDGTTYSGKRLRMQGWVKTEVSSGAAQLWVRVDGDWTTGARRDSFDNMGDRPIKGMTDWTCYSIVVDVPETSTAIFFGCMLIGTGKVWFDDVSFEVVNSDVQLTGDFTSAKVQKKYRANPINLSFETVPRK